MLYLDYQQVDSAKGYDMVVDERINIYIFIIQLSK